MNVRDMRFTITTTIAALVLGTSLAHGAIIDFTMEEIVVSDPPTAAENQVPVLATSELATGISSPSGKPNGVFGLGGSGTVAGEYNWSSWTANMEFLVVEFTVDAGYTATLENLTLDVSRNGGGAAENFYAVVLPGTGLDGATIGAGTHLDLQAVAIGNGANGGSFGLTQAWDLSSVAALSAGSYTIGWGTIESKPGNMRISDIVVNGTVTAVPEPGTLCLLGLGLFGLVALRRR